MILPYLAWVLMKNFKDQLDKIVIRKLILLHGIVSFQT